MTNLQNVLNQYASLSELVGGNFQDATNLLQKTICGSKVDQNIKIKLIVQKHLKNSKAVGGHFLTFINLLNKL